MARHRSARARKVSAMTELEDELTVRLERANELGRRVRRVTAKVQKELKRTGEIAATLCGATGER